MNDTALVPALTAPPLGSVAEAAAGVGRESELLEAARLVQRRRDNVLGLLLRALSREEIAVLEHHGCRAQDWSHVRVAQDFDPFRVHHVQFKGHCALGRFAGEAEVVPGITLPTGISNCTLINCQIGNDCLLENVRFAANVVIEREAVLYDVGSIGCSGAARFGCGQLLRLALESGGREVPLWAEITIDAAAIACRERGDAAGQQALRDAVGRYADAIASPLTWVRRTARVRHTERLHDCWIGAGAVIDHALDLSNVAILSSAEEPTTVSGGAAVTDAVLQWGVRVGGNAIVRHSVLLEHAAAAEHASIEHSLIGPNTTIAKGEVTSSLVGPFVGFHHQSLLISAFWPEGKGNVAYGAMVGSNHTGRAPDQEIWPGEGTFFGLGCAIRFPTDLSEAPYSVIGLGATTLPQKVRFPFSLITIPAEALEASEAHVPRAFNELIPGWTLDQGAYGLVRNELKFAARDRAKRHRIEYKILRPPIMRLVKAAHDRLVAVRTVKPVYLEEDIDGLGKNLLRDSVRRHAIAVYARALERYALRVLLAEAEHNVQIAGSSELAHELAEELLPRMPLEERLRRLVAIERTNAELVEASKAADDSRGDRVIPGYAEAHGRAGEDPVVRSAWERADKTAARVRKLGIAI